METKKAYYANLNEKDVTDNKQFWKQNLFSDKIKSCDKITLIDGEKIVTQDDENTEILNSFFSSAMKNLEEVDPLADQISHPILKARVKYRNHPSVIAIGNADNGSHFHFSCVSTNDVLKEIKKSLHKKWSFPIRISSVHVTKPLTEEILNGKLHFLRSEFDIRKAT